MKTVAPAGFAREGEVSSSASSLVFAVTRADGARAMCKRLSPRLVREPKAIAGIEREARLLDRLGGRGTPALLASGADEHGPYLVTARAEMPTLLALGAGGRAVDTVVVSRHALLALAEIHEAGDEGGPLAIVHGDVSPANVLASESGAVLVDLALGRSRDDVNVHVAAFSGTLAYAAPEAVRDERPTVRADLFSLAASLLYAWSGRAPRSATSRAALLALAAEAPLDRYVEGLAGLVSPELLDALAPCLAFDPEARPATAREVATALSRKSPRA